MGHDFQEKCGKEATEGFSDGQGSCLPARTARSLRAGLVWVYLLEYSASLMPLKKPFSSAWTLVLYLLIPVDLLEAINTR